MDLMGLRYECSLCPTEVDWAAGGRHRSASALTRAVLDSVDFAVAIVGDDDLVYLNRRGRGDHQFHRGRIAHAPDCRAAVGLGRVPDGARLGQAGPQDEEREDDDSSAAAPGWRAVVGSAQPRYKCARRARGRAHSDRRHRRAAARGRPGATRTVEARYPRVDGPGDFSSSTAAASSHG